MQHVASKQCFVSGIAIHAVQRFSRSRVNRVATTLKAQTIGIGGKHSLWASVGVSLFLVAMTWFVFGQTLGHSFTNYDDDTYVYQNPKIRAGLNIAGVAWAFTHVHAQNWHPLTTMSHMLDCRLYGLTSRGHHFTNVLLHTIAVVLLFVVLRRMTGALWRSAFVAAVFAIHPLRVESVAWIAERKDVLSGVFFMLTLGAYTHYARNPSVGRYMVMSTLFICGLMSKPMLMTTPFVLLLLDWWPLRRFPESIASSAQTPAHGSVDRQSPTRLVLEKVPLLILSLASGCITVLAQQQALGLPEQLPINWRIMNTMISYAQYIWQMFWPARLAVFYPHPENQLPLWEFVVAFLLLLVVTVAAVAWRKKYPYIFTGWFWFLGMLVPVIGILQVGWQGRADRYTYLPQVGLSIAIVWLLEELARERRASKLIAAAAMVTIALLSLLARAQASFWRNSEMLWRHALAVTVNNDVAENNLGTVLLAEGKPDEAISHFQNALSIRGQNAPAHENLARTLLQRGDLDGAMFHSRKLLELQPDNVEALNILGTMLVQAGRLTEAVDEWQEALRIDADNGNANSNLAWVYATSPDASLRDGAKAVELAEHAMRLSRGKNATVFRTLAAAYAESGRFSDAIKTAERGGELALGQGNAALAQEMEANIVRYKAGVALRDLSLTNRQSQQ